MRPLKDDDNHFDWDGPLVGFKDIAAHVWEHLWRAVAPWILPVIALSIIGAALYEAYLFALEYWF